MAKKKMHIWAVGITITIVLFLIAMTTLTIIISQEEYHLVTDNYYEKDLRYQKRIDSKKRTGALESRPVIEIDPSTQFCVISYPPRKNYDDISGNIVFFRISDARKDTAFTLLPDSEGRQNISTTGLQKGQWLVKVTWTEDDEEYYIEQRIFLR